KMINKWIAFTILSLLFSFDEGVAKASGPVEIGVSRIDITPDHPVRLTGYGNRTNVFDSVEQKLWAKALVLGQKGKPTMVWITLDLIGFPGYFADALFARLVQKIGLKDRAQLVVSATHTHNGPETGVLVNIFGVTPAPNELADVKLYRDNLLDKLEKLVIDAYSLKAPGKLSWAVDQVTFAMNRRVLEEGKWKDFGETPNGPVDHDLPVLRVTDLDGKLVALLINYACHGTTLLPEHNFIHGDWMGATQDMIEKKYPGATAMVAIGCGGDANPSPRGEFEQVNQHAVMITDKIDKLLQGDKFTPLNNIPVGKMKKIELTFAHVPDAKEFVEQSKLEAAQGLYARNSLSILAEGGSISSTMSYPVQVWSFRNQLAIVFLGGEVVVDYSLRIKREFIKEKIWINAYSNDVSTYIASKRLFTEGGYEVDGSMSYYNHPSRLTEDTEEKIINAVHELIPKEFLK
ncbi:MAG TPA: neutral/alkaline non-lysosomal ceramidase N-terminal domain-containing protein, partial [Saprospiraceae bacterium]|nr:neutral/alkaline non-lysosomal ceramidase N-terminal domain-containing protein [Saprospiraceae bacterium]